MAESGEAMVGSGDVMAGSGEAMVGMGEASIEEPVKAGSGMIGKDGRASDAFERIMMNGEFGSELRHAFEVSRSTTEGVIGGEENFA